jgi:hypothetical protein
MYAHAARNNRIQNKITRLERSLSTLSRQLMLQQFYSEEQARSNGDSGVKRTRLTFPNDGGDVALPIHNHANYERTIGLGEMVVVLNGVEFRTRHNDYPIRMKSLYKHTFGETQSVPLPEVPPDVRNYLQPNKQIAEMREWFKAWRDQDHSIRDYRQYFKPVLCYLEGSWTHSDQNSIDEPFDSLRHHLAAENWHSLLEKVSIEFKIYTTQCHNVMC